MLNALGIDRLSVAERLLLVEEIWDSIAAIPDQVPLTEDQIREIDRRLGEAETRPDDVIPWEEVKSRAQARLA